MSEQASTKRTRRQVLAGAAAALSAFAVESVARAPAAHAGTDGDVVLGASNSASSTTEIRTTQQNVNAFRAATVKGVAVTGRTDGDGPAIYGNADGYGPAVMGSRRASAWGA